MTKKSSASFAALLKKSPADLQKELAAARTLKMATRLGNRAKGEKATHKVRDARRRVALILTALTQKLRQAAA